MAAADTTPPVLNGLTLPNIDLSKGDQTITFSAAASDTGSGIDHVAVFLDHSFQGQYGGVSGLFFNDTTDSFSDGVSTDVERVKAASASGTYNVSSVQVFDKAGNYTNYSTAQLQAMHIATSFTLSGGAPPDTTPPVLNGLTLPNIDLSKGDQTITFSAAASDTGSGIDHVAVFLDHSFQGQYGGVSGLFFNDTTDSFSDGVSTDVERVKAASASGTYNVSSVQVFDKAGNYTNYSTAQLQAMHIATSFTLSGGAPPDTTPPVLNGLTLPNIDLSKGDQTITFSAAASDTGSGIDHVAVFLDHSFQGQYGGVSGLFFNDTTDSFSDGVSTDVERVKAASASGTYNVSSVQVFDKAGNYTNYSTAQLQAMHIATSFTLSDASTLVTPTVVINAPTQVQEGVDATLNLSLTFKAVSTVDSIVTVTYSPTSTATAGADIVVGTVQTAVHATQTPAADYTISLGKFAIVDDGLAEATETAVFVVKATGAVFANGTDTTTVTVPILDHAPSTAPVTPVAPVSPITPTTPVATPAQVGATAVASVLRLDATTGYGAAVASALSAQVYNGVLTSGGVQTLATAAVSTTEVASLAYQFFTGHTPTAAGMDYLVSPTGPNPNNLNSAYYAQFSTTNRYINFASNLGKVGEGAAAFQANYGALSLADATAKAYAAIFGTSPTADKVSHLLHDAVPNGLGGTYEREDYFASYGGDGLNGQGTKAAAVGWLIAQAAQSDVGTYAKADDVFLADVAVGKAAFGVDLVGAYAKPEYAYTGG